MHGAGAFGAVVVPMGRCTYLRVLPMNERARGIWRVLLAVTALGFLCVPEAKAVGHGSRGSRAPRLPHVSAPRGGWSAPRMPRAAAPARATLARARARTNRPNSRVHPTPGT